MSSALLCPLSLWVTNGVMDEKSLSNRASRDAASRRDNQPFAPHQATPINPTSAATRPVSHVHQCSPSGNSREFNTSSNANHAEPYTPAIVVVARRSHHD